MVIIKHSTDVVHGMGPSAIQLTWCRNDLFLFPSGSDAPVGRPFIPKIKADYVEVKGVFVKVCTTQGSPTLDEVKDHCIDLIEGAIADMPPISCLKEDIEKAKTMSELARVVCFRLSRWVSYDFFKKVIAHFQPALKSVKKRLMRYEDQLKPLLLQKLEYVAELQQRLVN